MTFDSYDEAIAEMDFMRVETGYSLPADVYYALALNGEAGEVAEKIKKVYRDKAGVYTFDDRVAIVKELGDCLWYISRLAAKLGWSLLRVASMNVEKLQDRKARGVQRGSGDNR